MPVYKMSNLFANFRGCFKISWEFQEKVSGALHYSSTATGTNALSPTKIPPLALTLTHPVKEMPDSLLSPEVDNRLNSICQFSGLGQIGKNPQRCDIFEYYRWLFFGHNSVSDANRTCSEVNDFIFTYIHWNRLVENVLSLWISFNTFRNFVF